LTTIFLFAASYEIGSLIRAQMVDGNVMKLLIFFAVIALTGGLLGAHNAGNAWALHNRVK
jgi:hypothetical protein